MKIEKRQTKNCLAICPVCESMYWDRFPKDKGWTLQEIKEHTKKFRLPKDTTIIELTTKLYSSQPIRTIICLKHAKDFGEKLLDLIDE